MEQFIGRIEFVIGNETENFEVVACRRNECENALAWAGAIVKECGGRVIDARIVNGWHEAILGNSFLRDVKYILEERMTRTCEWCGTIAVFNCDCGWNTRLGCPSTVPLCAECAEKMWAEEE